MKHLYFFRDYLTEHYGKALQRIPFDLGLSCPHRKPDGSGGCAFCAENGSAARHLSPDMSIAKQAERGIRYIKERYGAEAPYLAYFQSFTNTYADIETLKRLYEEALSTADYKIVIIATRPDCLSEECVEYLASLKNRYEVWVELGVQSANDATLKKINRGHGFAAVKDAVRRLDARGIKVAAHVILGLPGEDRKDYLATAEQIAALPFSGIKVHNLLILKGTPMARMLNDGEAAPLNEYEYAGALADFLLHLPEKMVVMRLSAEAEPSEVIAPKWWMKKGQFLEMFRQVFRERSEGNADGIRAVRTEDGSYTLYHPEYRQHFHSTAGARAESWKKYIEPCRIEERLATGDRCRDSRYRFRHGLQRRRARRTCGTDGKRQDSRSFPGNGPQYAQDALLLPDFPRKDVLEALSAGNCYQSTYAEVTIAWGDARQYVLNTQEKFDFLFLDAFRRTKIRNSGPLNSSPR